MNNNINEQEIDEAMKEAKKRLHAFINEEAIGYSYYLHEEMKKILRAKGIEWEYDNGSKSDD